MSPVNVNLTEEQVSVSVSGDDITATVSGGIGPSGLQGPAATIAVGTVTTGAPGSSAAVTNSGTTSAAVFDFTIPAGATGATGATGPAGPATTDASLLTTGTLNEARLPGSVVLTTDSRLTDSREWTADTISQAEAEAGTSTTRRAFTAIRVFQAVAAWWAGSSAKTKLDGIATGATANATDAQLRDRATHTGTQAIATVDGLQTALDGKASSSHTHGNLTNAGAIGTTSGLPVKTGASGVIEAGAFGTSAGTFAEGNHTHTQLHDRSHAITSTSDHTATAWRVFHSNGSGEVVELALGSAGQALLSNGATSAPSWGAAGSNSASDLTQGTLNNARLSSRARAAINVYLWSSFR